MATEDIFQPALHILRITHFFTTKMKVTMNEKCGADGPEAVNNASYVAYAYLGGQAKREQIFVTEKG